MKMKVRATQWLAASNIYIYIYTWTITWNNTYYFKYLFDESQAQACVKLHEYNKSIAVEPYNQSPGPSNKPRAPLVNRLIVYIPDTAWPCPKYLLLRSAVVICNNDVASHTRLLAEWSRPVLFNKLFSYTYIYVNHIHSL